MSSPSGTAPRWRRQHLTRTSPVATFTAADSDVVPWRTVFVDGVCVRGESRLEPRQPEIANDQAEVVVHFLEVWLRNITKTAQDRRQLVQPGRPPWSGCSPTRSSPRRPT